MHPYSYSLSLRISHPQLNPDDVSRVLQLTPKKSWRAGEDRFNRIDGKVYGQYTTGYWYCNLGEGERDRNFLNDYIEECVRRLAGHANYFREIATSGGRVEFFVAWYGVGNIGECFQSGLLRQLGEMSIDLSLDVYPTLP